MFTLLLLAFCQEKIDYPIDASAIARQTKVVADLAARLKKCRAAQINPRLAAKWPEGEFEESGVLFFSNQKQKEKEINLASAKLENAKDLLDLYKAGHFPPAIETKRNFELFYPLKIGDTGVLPDGFLKVFQVLEKGKLLGEIRFSRALDSNGAIIDARGIESLVMLKGVETTGVVDGMPYEFKQIFKVKTTETYRTTFGTKTVFLLEPFVEENQKVNQAEIAAKNAAILKRAKEIKLRRLAQESAEQKEIEKEKATGAAASARDSIAKLIRGLASYEQRFEDSFKESKESVMDQMQDQARTYIQGADKRLDAAIKEMEAAKMPEDERAKLVADARAAIAKAKKKVGIK